MNAAHLSALETRLSHERCHLSNAKNRSEKTLRAVWIRQIEKEIASELEFLGITRQDNADISDVELLAQLAE